MIDVGSPEGSRAPRLVYSKETEANARRTTTYTALSHCWGALKNAVCTTEENLHSHLAELDFDSLSKTCRDAISITRKLGIRYLWIDSICIVQDNAEDWEREAVMMSAIYSHAYLTIAAASASDSSGGCCIDDPLKTTTLEICLENHCKGMPSKGYIRYPEYRRDHFLDSPLHTRGWVLQEVILSRRTVYFTADQMFWLCRSYRHAEDGIKPSAVGFQTQAPSKRKTETGGMYWDRNTRRLKRMVHPGMLATYDLSKPGRAWETWWEWVQNFRSRQLTRASDRFAALAGLTKLYQSATGDRSLAGLWERSILRDLFWEVEPSIPAETRMTNCAPEILAKSEDEAQAWRVLTKRDSRRQLKNIPTWTWFAAEGLEIKSPNHPDIKGRHDQWEYKARYLGAHLLWSGEELTSSLLKATLVLRGRLIKLQLFDICTLRPFDCKCGSEPEYRVDVAWDYFPPNGVSFWGLLIAEELDWDKRVQARKLLILRKTGHSYDEYQRQGITKDGRFHKVHFCISDLEERAVWLV